MRARDHFVSSLGKKATLETSLMAIDISRLGNVFVPSFLVLCIIVLYFPFFIVAVYYQSYYVTYFHICIMFWRVFFWKTFENCLAT